MPHLHQDKIEQVLLIMIDEMIKRKELTAMSPNEKKDLVHTVIKAMEKNLGPREDLKLDSELLKNDGFRKTLMHSLILGQGMQKNPSLEFDLSVLFNKENVTRDELADEFQKELMLLAKLDPSVKLTNDVEAEIKNLSYLMADFALTKKQDGKMLAETEEDDKDNVADRFLVPMMDPLTAIFIQNFGQDTRIGGMAVAVQAVVEGEVRFPDKGGETFAKSLAGEVEKLEGYDPTGAKAATDASRISKGAFSDALAEEFEHEGLLRPSIKPHLPGTATD